MKSLVITYTRTADGRSGDYDLTLRITDEEASDRTRLALVLQRTDGALQQRDNGAVRQTYSIIDVPPPLDMPVLTADEQRAAYDAASLTTKGMAPSFNEVAVEAQKIVAARGQASGDVGTITATAPLADVVDAVRSGAPISLDNPHIVEAAGVVLSGEAGDADGDGRISLDEITSDSDDKGGISVTGTVTATFNDEKAHTDWSAKAAENKAKSTAAYALGVKAVEDILNGDVAYDAPMFEDAFTKSNPFKHVSWGDPGVEFPAFQAGFNDALAKHYGVKKPEGGYDDRPEDMRSAFNGRRADGGTFASFDEAVIAARDLTQAYGIPFIAEDRTASTSPRFAVIRDWQIGEPVSYGFNGDSYIAGRITAMGGEGGNRIITVMSNDGKKERKFWRRKLTASWKFDGTWSLMHGWHNDTNPEF